MRESLIGWLYEAHVRVWTPLMHRCLSEGAGIRPLPRVTDEKLLGLQTCYGSGDMIPALSGITSRAKSVRTLSTVIVSRLGTDDDVRRMLDCTPPHLLPRMLHTLRRQRRQKALDAFLDTLAAAESDDQLLKKYLSVGSEVVIKKWLPQLLESLDAENWRRLARSRPYLV